MTARKLREWRGVKQVAAPAGIAITTRVATSERDDAVLLAVAVHTSTIRRADLAARTGASGAQQDTASRAARKRGMTAASSSRMAGTIMHANDDQYRLARMAQTAHVKDMKAAVATITARLAAPTQDRTDDPTPKRKRRGSKAANGYATQAERYQKQRRMQVLTARIASAEKDAALGKVHVVAGGARLLSVRNNLEDAGLTAAQWREQWDASREVFEANGSTDEPHGNSTITVAPDGTCSIRLPRPLEHLANAPRGRYILAAVVAFPYRGDDWAARTATGAVSYVFTRRAGRAGWYLTASWALAVEPVTEPIKVGYVAGVDLNDGHIAVRLLDERGNPTGAPARIDFALTGTAKCRDAQVRHAITRLIRWCVARGVDTVAVEDLNFADARATSRETMGRGGRGKTFRRTVAGIPTAVFRNRLAGMVANTGLRLLAVNPAYTSAWGDQHWRKPYGITRHEAAATVIGRRAQGLRARRRTGVTCGRPADRPERATVQASSVPLGTSDGRRWDGRRRNEGRPLAHDGTRPSRRATVTPAPLANSGQRH